MSDLNLFQCIGRLGRDPELRTMSNGDAVCSISVGVSQSWVDKATGERRERTEWVSVEAFRKLAEIMGQYLRKGGQVYIAGELRTDKYVKDGVEKYRTKVIASQMQMLASPKGSAGDAAQAPADDGLHDDDIPF